MIMVSPLRGTGHVVVRWREGDFFVQRRGGEDIRRVRDGGAQKTGWKLI